MPRHPKRSGVVIAFDLLGYGRLERSVEALVRFCEPALRLVGVHCALLYSDARPRRAGSAELLAGQGTWDPLTRLLREEFGALAANTPPDSPWRPALGIAGVSFSHAMSVGQAACALAVGTGRRTFVVTRAGPTGMLMNRLLRHPEVSGGARVRVVQVLPASLVAAEQVAEDSVPAAGGSVNVVSRGVLLVAQSSAIQQLLEKVALEVRTLRPALRVQVLDTQAWQALVDSSREGGAEVSEVASSALLSDVLDGPGLVAARKAARDVLAAVTLLKKVLPRVVVVGNDRFGAGAIAATAARRVGITAVLVQDGIAADIPAWWVSTADVICSCGQQLADILRRTECVPKRMLATGQPRSHAVRRNAALNPDEWAVSAKPQQCILVILQVHHGPAYWGALFDCIAFVAQSGRVAMDVIVRCHPQHKGAIEAHVAQIIAEQGWRLDLSPSPIASLELATLVLGEYSTVLVEAILVGIPAASFEPSLVPPPLSLARSGVTVPFANGEELLDLCVRPAAEAQAAVARARMAAEYLLGKADLGASLRVATIVAALADAGPPGP